MKNIQNKLLWFFINLFFIGLLAAFSDASMTKMYIGNEDDQSIIGIEAISGDRDGGGGLEIRTYFRKDGVIVNGQEYGAKPGKVRYTFSALGKNEFGSLMKIRRSWYYSNEPINTEYDNVASLKDFTQFELGYGKGPHIIYP